MSDPYQLHSIPTRNRDGGNPSGGKSGSTINPTVYDKNSVPNFQPAGEGLVPFVKSFGIGGETSRIINNITQTNGQPIAVRDQFFNALEKWEASIPLNNLWMIFFKVPRIVSDATMEFYGEHIFKQPHRGVDSSASALQIAIRNSGVSNHHGGSIDLARSRLNDNPELNTDIGVVFAQTVGLPPEQNATNYVGPNQRGFLKGPVLDQRQQFSSINIEFLETNISFVDFLIRPWVVISAHEGYVASHTRSLITSDLMLVNFAKAGVEMISDYAGNQVLNANNDRASDPFAIKNQRGFMARKIWHFSGCTPVNVANERYSYQTEAQADRRDTEWVFKRYHIMMPPDYSQTMDAIEAGQQDDAMALWKGHIDHPDRPQSRFHKSSEQENKRDAEKYWRGQSVAKYGQPSSSEDKGALHENKSRTPAQDGAAIPWTDEEAEIQGYQNADEANSAALRRDNPWNKKAFFGMLDSKSYWAGDKTPHHEGTKDGSTRKNKEGSMNQQKPYGINRVTLGEEGTVVQESDNNYGWDETMGETEVTNEYYQMSEREATFSQEGHAGLVKKDAKAYWSGTNPYPVKPTPTGSTGPYPAREAAPRAPIEPVRKFSSGRPDRFDFFGLFGL